MRTQLCRLRPACRLLFLLLAVLVGAGSASALTLSTTKPKIGEPIHVLDPVAGRHYSVFWINLDGPRADPCAVITGYELLEVNDLRHYGTCFVNDDGTFQVVELGEDLLANYTDSIQHPSYVTKQTVVVKGWLFEFVMTAQGLSVPRGEMGHTALTATLSTGTANPVTFDLIGLPDGVRGAASPEACTPTCTVTISFDVAARAAPGGYPITVIANGIGAPSQSATFTLTVLAGGLTRFRIEAGAGGDIGTQKAGQAFPIRVTAQNADYSDNTSFTGTVDLSTTAGAVTPAVSGSFVNGVRTENVVVTMPGTGRTLSASSTGATASGTSNGFTVLDGGPVTTIVSYPVSPSNNPSPSFTFSASEPGTTFECKLDAAAWTPCTSPLGYTSVPDGTHTFQVRGTTNGYTESAPPSVTWQLDTTAPDTGLDSAPPVSTYVTSAMFLFSATESGSTFQCRMDGAVFAPCVSPVTIGSVAYGRHTFEVRATDPAGNVDVSAAGHTWTVERRPLAITALDRSKAYGDEVTFSGTEFSVAGLQSGDSVSGVALASTGAAASAPAGTHAIVPSAAQGSGLSNYVISYVSGTLTVGKAASATRVVCADATYTGAAVESCTASASGGGGLNQVLPVSYVNNLNAGTASASASFAGDANHDGTTASATFVIAKTASVATVVCTDATYTGAAIESCTASVSGSGGLNQALAVTYANNREVGTASANASFPGDGNYTASTAAATFTVNPGSLDHFLVEAAAGGPIGARTAGTPFTVRVVAQDAYNNTVTAFNAPATLTSTGALAGGPVTTPAFVGGVLTSQSITITGAGTVALTATATGKTGTSATFLVNPGAAHHLAFGVQPTNISAGKPMSPAVAVRIVDAYNNLVANDNTTTVSLSIGANPGGAVLTNGGARAAVNGVATFSGVALDKAGTNYTLTANSPSTPVLIGDTSAPFTITANLTLTVSVSAMSFGNVPLATASATRTVTLSNTSTNAIPLTSITTGNSDFAVTTDTCAGAVPAKVGTTNGTCSLTVTLTPTSIGPRTGTLTAFSGDAGAPSVSLSGTGTYVLAASVSAVEFGNVPVASASLARTVTLTNANGIAIPLTSVAPDNGEFAIAANTCGGSVPARSGTTNGTCSLTLKLTPAAIGGRAATLTIVNGATNTPVISLSGTGTLLLAASVSAVDFGYVTVGTASTARTVTLTNVNGIAIPLASVATGNLEFAITANTCGTAVPAKAGTTNGSCTLTLKLTPVAAGTRTATLTIVSGATNPLAVSLAGTGTTP